MKARLRHPVPARRLFIFVVLLPPLSAIMSTVALADICLELPSLEPKYIKDVLVPHLILEFDMGGSVIASTRLSWYNANRTHPQPTTGIWASWWQLLFGTSEVIHRPLGDENRVLVEGTTVKERKIWSTNKKLAMNDLVGELEISAWIELGAEEYELIGSAKLNGSTLYESVGKELGRTHTGIHSRHLTDFGRQKHH
ncbi:hypothetical protein CPB86DRAFT_381723 [Serendipita vermifera]|nr:hypothetical protein CPB86DRAFT_129614 [Serendipita vermifera]PVG03706.1 hypothetical protein CPB86DRAFT_381723 [Serendipita vermifera]